MKVDITLTVGGTDVTIDYKEGMALFKDLKALYEPTSREDMPYSVLSSGSSSCAKKSKVEEIELSDETQNAIDEIDELANPEFIETDLVTDPEINKEIVDAEIAERMKKMQDIVDKMNP